MNVKNFIIKHRSTLAGIAMLLAFRWSFADHYRVPTGSMEPTIQVGDHILANKMAYNFRIPFTSWVLGSTGEIQRGDIIIFEFPKDPSTTLVKRAIGLPGDHIKIQGQKLFINDSLISEPYVDFRFHDNNLGTLNELVVPEGMLFVLGDNRENSFDSRFWGLVPAGAVKGKALRVLWNVTFNNAIPELNLQRTLSALYR